MLRRPSRAALPSPLRERFVVDDETNIRRTLELAERGRGLVSPNPLVGALVVAPDGSPAGEGWHEGPGKPHAEVVALAEAGERARGGTLFCSLEPCNHVGRTPACTEAIVDAGITRVVAAVIDPNPITNGRGIARLREAGIEASAGVLEEEASRQNEAFFWHMKTGLPFVTLKLAATLDGKIAARDGSSTWITGDESRAEVQRLRAASDAIMVGAGTVVTDNPHLTARDPEYRGEPVLRVVIDGSGRVNPTSHVFDDEAPLVVATTDAVPVATRETWRAGGADVLIVETDGDGRVSIDAVLADLGKRDIQSVLLEGGSTLADTAIRAGVVGKVILFFAPKLLGGVDAPSILGGRGFPSLAEAAQLAIVDVERIGPDVKVEAYVHRNR